MIFIRDLSSFFFLVLPMPVSLLPNRNASWATSEQVATQIVRDLAMNNRGQDAICSSDNSDNKTLYRVGFIEFCINAKREEEKKATIEKEKRLMPVRL